MGNVKAGGELFVHHGLPIFYYAEEGCLRASMILYECFLFLWYPPVPIRAISQMREMLSTTYAGQLRKLWAGVQGRSTPPDTVRAATIHGRIFLMVLDGRDVEDTLGAVAGRRNAVNTMEMSTAIMKIQKAGM